MAGAETRVKKSDLPARTASAVVMVAVAGAALWLGGWWWNAFVILVGAGVYAEWSRLVLAIAHGVVARLLWMLGGMLYIGTALIVLALLRSDFLGLEPTLLVLLAVIAIDVGAYFAGRLIGGPKIAPAISPSKTWAGLFGGMVGATAVLLAFEGASGRFYMGAVLAVIAQAGDFFESWMKRRAGVKDSGNLIPGHGGLFDRVDGLIAVLFAIGMNAAIPRLVEWL